MRKSKPMESKAKANANANTADEKETFRESDTSQSIMQVLGIDVEDDVDEDGGGIFDSILCLKVQYSTIQCNCLIQSSVYCIYIYLRFIMINRQKLSYEC